MLACYLAAVAGVADKGQCGVFRHGFDCLHGFTIHSPGGFQVCKGAFFASAHVNQNDTVIFQAFFQLGHTHLLHRLRRLWEVNGQA